MRSAKLLLSLLVSLRAVSTAGGQDESLFGVVKTDAEPMIPMRNGIRLI